MRIYEELFIAKPDATEEELDALIEQMKTIITTGGGTVNKVEKWGKRRLAYKVGKYREGEYVLIEFQAEAEAVSEFERRLRVADMVIKFLTVRIDETLKQIEKRKKHREKRASRKASAAPAAPVPSMAQQMLGEPPAAVPGAPAPGLPQTSIPVGQPE
jgi:small subunit ribosomal protein S6